MRHILAVVVLAAVSPACAGTTFPVDDSYTISQRYAAYKADHPEMEMPRLVFEAGQQILFDRLYKTIGDTIGDRELHVDVFLPLLGHANRQAVMLVHGGAWRAGNKSNFYALANQLAQRGYVVFTPELRLALEAPYPAGLIDINDAIVWAKAHAGEYGFDAGKLAIGGESAGGQMASLLAYSADRDTFKSAPGLDTHVAALIDLDGLFDFMTPLALKAENAKGEKSSAALWLSGAYETAGDKWREASAARYVSAKSPPTLVIASELPRFTAGYEEIKPVLDRHHIRNAFIKFEHLPHSFWLFEPYVTRIAIAIDAFLSPAGTAKP
jgi:pectinesterase